MNETFLMDIENLVWVGHLAEYWTLKNYLEMFLEFQAFVIKNTQINIVHCGKQNNRSMSPVNTWWAQIGKGPTSLYYARYSWVTENFTKNSCAKLFF